MNSNDHRIIGHRLDLFHQQDASPGMVFWHPRGAALYRVLEEHVRSHMRRAGFQEVRTPQLQALSLWKQSGHLEKFDDAMFVVGEEERRLALKPMNCPGHIQIFRKRVRSYRDLPIRYAEFGLCHRDTPSGSLHGLMRTRAFVQDDAHIFCRHDQIGGEVQRFCRLLRTLYAELGFGGCTVRFATRPAVRAGSDETWDRAEAALHAAARSAGLDYTEHAGEGAFYGPKLEFVLRDNQAREWQCGTVQLDLILPDRLDAEYIDAGSRRVRPVLIHHAILGSLERFIGILLEHYDGRLPFWLAPEQIVVAPVGEAHLSYADRVVHALLEADLRVRLDDRAETLSRRLAEAVERGVPVFAAVGDREVRHGTVSIRRRGDETATLPLLAAIEALKGDAKAGANLTRGEAS